MIDIETTHDEILQGVEVMNCGFLARDNAGVVLYSNKRLLDWLQRTRSEIVGRSMDTLFPEEIVDVIHDELKAVAAGDMRVRLAMLVRKDGTTFPVLVIPNKLTDELGTQVGGIGIIVDLGSVQTAKTITYGSSDGLRGMLSHIALEIQSLALTAELAPSSARIFEQPELHDLSPREREVVALLLAGERVPGIASLLYISPHTARNHLKSVFRKLDVGNQSDLITKLRSLAG
jgi:PAS domain S-box-containing protein